MFSFFKKKPKSDPNSLPEVQLDTPPVVPGPALPTETLPEVSTPAPDIPEIQDKPVAVEPPLSAPKRSWLDRLTHKAVEPEGPLAPPPPPQPPIAEPAIIPPVVPASTTIINAPVQQKPAASVPPAVSPPAFTPALPVAPLIVAAEPEEFEEEIVVPAAVAAEQKRSWLTRLKTGLSKTSSNLTTLFVGAKINDDLYEELESALLVSDAGVDATQFVLNALKKTVKDERLTDALQVKAALRSILIKLLTPLQKPMEIGKHQPLVMMIAGVNGAGKTTTIGKLAKHLQAHKQSVLLAAGDTFRAAAREQLTIWGERNNVSVIAQESGDPAAVAFDAVHSAQARGINVVMIDTAGRLPTQLHLMEELKKVKRVIAKGMASAPHEILLVIDGNTGQNALAQVKAFDDALGLTGLVITKLDGTAKGGILAAIAITRAIPVYFIGVGEQIEDLQPFDATDFVDALLR
ncbi:signal recognition particle-docking protein FtsY [Glaciimonas immobilis]|uniref:Signal recognition particle receptor FtsY n=1 Tax=Glaciimonas immobilis TaxID=728004 RepID=A0A840RTJ3_9BURK|nr:signal recognition particle-docking protein FtsY [Glaciimonas immobilis]MBB5200246.1 fused signal recognition particle receptor [Glaciimonas immobilis]